MVVWSSLRGADGRSIMPRLLTGVNKQENQKPVIKNQNNNLLVLFKKNGVLTRLLSTCYLMVYMVLQLAIYASDTTTTSTVGLYLDQYQLEHVSFFQGNE